MITFTDGCLSTNFFFQNIAKEKFGAEEAYLLHSHPVGYELTRGTQAWELFVMWGTPCWSQVAHETEENDESEAFSDTCKEQALNSEADTEKGNYILFPPPNIKLQELCVTW